MHIDVFTFLTDVDTDENPTGVDTNAIWKTTKTC